MAKAKNQEELQADLEKLKAKEKALKARIRAAQARESAAVRKKRNHALMTMGSWCEIACGGDWTAIDWKDVHDMLMKYSGNYKKTAKHSGRKATEANDALREYERELRNGGKAEQQPQGEDEGKPTKTAGGHPKKVDPAQIEAARARIAEATRKGAENGD